MPFPPFARPAVDLTRMFIGRFFGRLSTEYMLTLLLSPRLRWASENPYLRHRKSWGVVSLNLILVAIPLVGVLILSKQTFGREIAPLL